MLTSEGRVVVRVVDEDYADGEDDGVDDCRSSTFALDTAYDVNAVSPSCSLAPTGRTATIVTSQPTQMAVAHLPRRFRMGKAGLLGWFSGSSLVSHLERDDAAREAVVLPAGSLPRSLGGILGRSFLESPAFGSVTFGVGCSSFRTGLSLSSLRREASFVAQCDASRDGHFGLFVLSNVRLLGGRYRFIVDTGASPILFEKNMSRLIAQRLGNNQRRYPLNMSGSSVTASISTSPHECYLGTRRASSNIVVVSGNVSHPSVLNRDDGVCGLLGTEALRGLLIDIRNGTMTLWKPRG